MTSWWWVRHGPTHQKAFTGWRDVPADLSDTAALQRLDAYLPKDALVVSSDLIRASTTADAFAGKRQRLESSPAIREFDFGDWDGLTFPQVSERDPLLSRAFWDNPGELAPPNGESWNDLGGRIGKFVQSISNKHGQRDVIAVAHFGAILTQVAVATQSSPVKTISQKIDNLSVTRITYAPSPSAGPINHCP